MMLAKSLPALVAEQVKTTPNAVAVIDGEQTLTYAELDRASARVAAVLRARGVRTETFVGVLMERSSAVIVAVLGILRAGGAYVPFPPRDPAERTRTLLRDTGIELVLVDATTRDRDLGDRVATIDATSTSVDQTPAEHVDVGPDQACYVMFTSGSTGRPKGVVVTHRNVVGLAADPVFDSSCFRRFLVHSPFSFDGSTLEIWVPLVRGGTLVVAPPGDLEPRDIGTAIRDHGVTAAWVTTGLFNLMVADHVDLMRPLEALWTGGDRASTAAVLRAMRHLPDTDLVNGYGPTEITTLATFHRVTGDQPADLDVPIGVAMADKVVRVLGSDLTELPDGVVGELCVGGGGVARGYHAAPARTAVSFIPDPHGPPGARLYRTGDLVKRGPDGVLDFIGRTDDQVKIRGYRVEPGEIEAVVGALPGTADQVVVVRNDPAGGKRLVAYVVLDSSIRRTAAELRADLVAALPEHMVPVVVVVDALPLTPNGKVDRAALPTPRTGSASGEPPGTALEHEVARVFAELLGVSPVHLDDDFLDLGGDSLLAMRAAARLREQLGIDLPSGTVFRGATVRAVADACARADRTEHDLPRAAEPVVSFGQRRLWYLDQVTPGDPGYVLPFALRLRGELDPDALSQALGAVVDRHDSLRTAVVTRDGEPHLVVSPPGTPPSFTRTDLSSLGGALDEVAEYVAERARLPFVLSEAPLLRAELARLGPDDHLFVLFLHHIAADGWSMGLIAGELAEDYRVTVAGGVSPVRAPDLRYVDYSAWEQRTHTDERLEAGLAFWGRQLTGAPAWSLPTDRPRGRDRSSRGGVVVADVPDDLLSDLRELGKGRNATLFTVLLAAFQAFLGRYSGHDEVTVGTAVANRARSAFENIVGFFTNTLAIRSVVDPTRSFDVTLDGIRDVVHQALAHQHVPFDRVVDRAAPDRDGTSHPLFQVMFVLQNTPAPRWDLAGLSVAQFPVAENSRFDLTLYAEPHRAGLRLRFVYSTELFDRATIEAFAAGLTRFLREVTREPTTPLGILPTAELPQAGPVIETRPTGPLASDRVARQARAQPDAIAVVCGSRSLTYRELDRAASGLAAALLARGIHAEDRVGLYVERGLSSVIGMVGILRSGATYVPLDHEMPAARAVAIAADAGLVVVVGDESTPPLAPVVRIDRLPDGDVAGLDRPDPANAAYLVYTSGSSGKPKGVLGTHGGLANYLDYAVAEFGLTRSDRVLQLPALSYDASLRDILVPLAAGAAVVLLEHEVPKTPETVAHAIERHGITALLSVVPSMLREFGLLHGELGRALRVVVSSGESIRLLGDQVPPATWRLMNQYGPTECTMTTTFCPVRPPFTDVVGRPIPSSRVHVLDSACQPVPTGALGELFIAGAGLARGYDGSPGPTAERFRPDPYGPPGSRMYRTGDRGRVTASGEVEFLGRADRQVKIRGNRVEPAEIEATLADHPSVARSAVRVSGGPDPVLLAFVEPEVAAVAPAERDLRAHVARALPAHMVPTAIEVLPRLPTTVSGKIDYGALPDVRPRRALDIGFVAPRNQVEQRVAAIWRDLLDLDQVGVHDTFFDLGGHSLLATRIVSRLRQSFPVDFTVADFLDAPTVEGVAAGLVAAHSARMRSLFGNGGGTR